LEQGGIIWRTDVWLRSDLCTAEGCAGEGVSPLSPSRMGFSVLDVRTCILECRNCFLNPFILHKLSHFNYWHVQFWKMNIANLLKTSSSIENQRDFYFNCVQSKGLNCTQLIHHVQVRGSMAVKF